jgi:hypothetical protein
MYCCCAALTISLSLSLYCHHTHAHTHTHTNAHTHTHTHTQRAACRVAVREVATLAAAGQLQPAEVQAAGQGLAAIPAALQKCKAGVSGVKLVVAL